MKRLALVLVLTTVVGLASATALASALPELYHPAALALEAGNIQAAISAMLRMPAANEREAMLTLAYGLKSDRIRSFIYSKRVQDVPGAAYELSSFYLPREGYSAGAKQLLLDIGSAIAQPDDGGGLAWLATVYESRGAYDGALQLYALGHEVYPKNAALAEGLGQQYLRKGDADKAVLYLTRAHLLEPQQPSHMVGLGRAFYAARRPDRTLELWSKALVMDPSNATLYKDIQRLQAEVNGGSPTAAFATGGALGSAAPTLPTPPAPPVLTGEQARPASTGTSAPVASQPAEGTKAPKSLNATARQVLDAIRAWLS